MPLTELTSDQRQVLARVYTFILTLPDPSDDSEEKTVETAVETQAQVFEVGEEVAG